MDGRRSLKRKTRSLGAEASVQGQGKQNQGKGKKEKNKPTSKSVRTPVARSVHPKTGQKLKTEEKARSARACSQNKEIGNKEEDLVENLQHNVRNVRPRRLSQTCPNSKPDSEASQQIQVQNPLQKEGNPDPNKAQQPHPNLSQSTRSLRRSTRGRISADFTSRSLASASEDIHPKILHPISGPSNGIHTSEKGNKIPQRSDTRTQEYNQGKEAYPLPDTKNQSEGKAQGLKRQFPSAQKANIFPWQTPSKIETRDNEKSDLQMPKVNGSVTRDDLPLIEQKGTETQGSDNKDKIEGTSSGIRKRTRRSLKTGQKGDKENFEPGASGEPRHKKAKKKSQRNSENIDPKVCMSPDKMTGVAKRPGQKLQSPVRSPLMELNTMKSESKRTSPKGPEDLLLARQSSEIAVLANASSGPILNLRGSSGNLENIGIKAQAQSGIANASQALPQDPDWYDASVQSKVHAVEAALHVSNAPTEDLPLCRTRQTLELLNILNLHISNQQGGAVYVSGLPGTGKTLSVHSVANQLSRKDIDQACSVVSINCMSLQQPSAVFSRALSGFKASKNNIDQVSSQAGTSLPKDEAIEALRSLVSQPITTPSKKGKISAGMLLLILDEMDQLISQDKSVLYELFSLPQVPKSRLILVGISNSIDMAERRLPRLREMGCHPHIIPFNSYSPSQIVDVVNQRLDSLPGPVFQPQAISFCSRKIGSQSGDMRRVLEACSSALHLHKTDYLAQLKPQPDSEEQTGSRPEMEAVVPIRRLIGISDMAKAISKLQGGSGEESALVQGMRALPQQQQIALCAAANMLTQRENSHLPPIPPSCAKSSFKTYANTPPSTSKVPKSRVASFISPGGGSPSISENPFSKFQTRPTTPFMTPTKGGTPSKGFGRTLARTPSSSLKSGLTTQECLLGGLHESYTHMCRKISMKPLSSLEFATACNTLADMGIIYLGNAKEERLKKISLKAHKDDIALALGEVRLLRNVLSLA